jgi:hypothetical protein
MTAVDTIEMRLSELQRSVDVGNAKMDGQLALLVQRSDQAALTLAEQRRWVEAEFARRDKEAQDEEKARIAADETLAKRTTNLERRAAMYAGATAVLGAGAGSFLTHLLSH